MRKQKKTIIKDLIFRKEFLKYEYKKIILKSIIQNQTNKNNTRFHAYHLLNKLSLKTNISKQTNPCLVTGRVGGVYKKVFLTRQAIKKLNNMGRITNLKCKSW